MSTCFHGDHLVFVDEPGGELVQEIFERIRDVGIPLCDFQFGVDMAIGALGFFGQTMRVFCQPTFVFPECPSFSERRTL